MMCMVSTRRGWRSGVRRIGIFGACILLTFALLSGCSLEIRAGHEPDISALEHELIPGKSTRGQVVAAIGWPCGEGRALMPFHGQPRYALTYYYEEVTLGDDRRMFLFVFMDEGKYEGYMWFSSFEPH